MKMSVLLAGVVFAALLAPTLKAQPKVLCEGFLPKNNLRIPVGDVRAAGIAEAQFNAVMDRVQAVYGPIIASHGATLQINRLWDDPTVNASAEQQGNTWILNMYGGLARHKAVTYDGMMLVACHELGHHLGGFPKINGADWATNEGGADYFATLKCLRRTLPATDPDQIDSVAQQGCAATYKGDAAGRASCERGAMAGVSVSTLLAELGQDGNPKLDTPDTSEVSVTNDEHPASQCRLDTYYQGALCTKKVDENQTNTEPATGACTKSQGYKVGLRSRCWYAPAAGAESTGVADVAQRLNITSPKALQERLDAMRAALSAGGR